MNKAPILLYKNLLIHFVKPLENHIRLFLISVLFSLGKIDLMLFSGTLISAVGGIFSMAQIQTLVMSGSDNSDSIKCHMFPPFGSNESKSRGLSRTEIRLKKIKTGGSFCEREFGGQKEHPTQNPSNQFA